MKGERKLKVGDKVKIYGTDFVGTITGETRLSEGYWVGYTHDYVYYIEAWPPEWLEKVDGPCTCGAKAVNHPGHAQWCDAI